MPRSHVFQHLKTTNCWPNDPEVFERFTALYGTGNEDYQEELADMIKSVLGPAPKTPLNDDSVGEWSPRETLQICLLNLDIFQPPDECRINDPRGKSYSNSPCQNKKKLIQRLAQDLEHFDSAMQASLKKAMSYPRRHEAMLGRLDEFAREYEKANRNRQLHTRGRPTPRNVKKYISGLRAAVNALRDADRPEKPPNIACRDQLVESIILTFRAHGPAWPLNTIIHAIHAILTAFKIIKHSTTTRALTKRINTRFLDTLTE